MIFFFFHFSKTYISKPVFKWGKKNNNNQLQFELKLLGFIASIGSQ